jgi:NADH-quinone oxidoreductase subunit K
MCIEMMLNAVNLTFLAFSKYMPSRLPTGNLMTTEASMSGQVMVIFVMAVAAAEVAVGLGIIMAIFRLRQDIDIDEMNLLRG